MPWNNYLVDLDIPKEWKCTSFVHDELPSYQVKGLHIWMGSHDAKEREADARNIWDTDWVKLPRFIVQSAKTYNGESDDDHAWLCSTDSFDELQQFVKEYNNED